MSMKKYQFGFGAGSMELSLPSERILYDIKGTAVEAIDDVPSAVRQALRNPIGAAPLAQTVQAGDKVVITVGDITRAWIKHDQFLPTVLDELNTTGVPDTDISIVVTLGAHRPHTPAEDIAVCGGETCHRVKVYQHDSHDEANLVQLGTTSGGVPIIINRRVAEAENRRHLCSHRPGLARLRLQIQRLAKKQQLIIESLFSIYCNVKSDE